MKSKIYDFTEKGNTDKSVYDVSEIFKKNCETSESCWQMENLKEQNDVSKVFLYGKQKQM